MQPWTESPTAQQRQGGAKNLLPKKNMKNGIGSSNTTKDKKLGKK